MKLEGMNVLLTGGSRGLGPVIARALASKGASIALSARSAPALQQVAADIERSGARAVAIPADVTNAQARRDLVSQTRDALGSIDVLVNNAGIEWVSHFDRLDEADIERIVATNLLAPLMLTRLVLPEMLERESGHVVTISSLGGKKGTPYSATYAATKAGLNEWSCALRQEVRGSGVGVSVVVPGFVSEAGMFAEYGKRAPRIAGESSPEAVAQAVVRAVTKNVGEIIVNPGPVKLMMMANALSPRLMEWVLGKAGVYAFYRRQAEDNQREP